MKTPSGFLTLQQVAFLLSLRRETLCRWVRCGRIKSWKPGKVRYIALDDVKKFL
ncbi:MAG: excisionase family DNA-binding protein [Elusimicrobia bacterium]|nr:excisionase family DNA-binding protein [Elusimicrobiota bacterium]MBK7546225.1 excisionase family DNA-binding protein [Elusimicrobiota bacterium]MBK7575774.1 excisionase family DNA-binding protein [Elusimicrobiota bacterium]MBK8127348.1 excisionase family DNA-binding protein [Elusimicrobiota bacterium]MBK8652196.1 excisionase family DNA-binding protein [Elusimicrobiota bacterium]